MNIEITEDVEMEWIKPKYSKNQINKAGEIIIKDNPNIGELLSAYEIVDNWRLCHSYPINTFQSTLRTKLKKIDKSSFLVSQRIKRMPSIISKLKRFPKMQMARMQDLGGLRAVVSNLTQVYELYGNYKNSSFDHELVLEKDYISDPKESGYRSIHLVYKYKNEKISDYNGLYIELQLRTKLQHAWATAVETMGTFLNYALKSSEGPKEWLNFFALASSAFAYIETASPVKQFAHLDKLETFKKTISEMKRLLISDKLQAFSIAAKKIHMDKKKGSYHLISLDIDNKVVNVKTFPQKYLYIASNEYTKLEKRISLGENIQAVLVSTDSIKNLKRAYPSFFLDTREFVSQINRIEKQIQKMEG